MPHLIWIIFCLIFSHFAFGKVTHGQCELEIMQYAEQIDYQQVGSIRVFSLIGRDKRLQNEAEFAGRDARVQKDIDNLIERELRGDKQPAVSVGFGRVPLGNGYFELKSKAGGRVYIRRVPNDSGGENVYVLGKATKNGSGNDYKVLNILHQKYSDLPPPPDSMSDRRGK
jgi:hypothetical protein